MAYTDIDKPSEHFGTLIFTGDNTNNRDITGLDFTPDFTWITSRAAASDNGMFDSVRGATKSIRSNSNRAEDTSPDNKDIDSFISGGIRVDQSNYIDTNTNNALQVAWNWKAANGNTTNTDGDVDTVISANQAAGFSIVSYTVSGTNPLTTGHGLSKAPELMLWRSRARESNWTVYAKPIGNAKKLSLNGTGAEANTGGFNSTTPSSTLFTHGGYYNADTIIYYAFHSVQGYSKIGSYTSINDHDSNFIYLGFKPAMIIFKNTSYSGGSDWHIIDRTRYTFNGASEATIELNTTDAENYSAFGEIDFVSNGFKIRNNNGVSSGGYDHIYMAFAENPFVTSTGIPATAR
jgi:hypothetical protein